MSGTHYDVVVVGGGINGTGVAQAAAAAGYSVLLLEKQAIAAGTSSKSSKLIHGGLRYLESFELGLVAESLHERALLMRIAPDLVKLQQFYLPIYRGMRRGPLLIRTGLSLYYLLSGLNPDARFHTLPRRRWSELGGLREEGLRRVFCYTDARTDDAALTRAVMRSAESLGAELACPARFAGAELHDRGCELHYEDASGTHTVNAGVLVNAAGPWVNLVADQVEPAITQVAIELVQGSHIEIAGELSTYFYYVESPRDGRAVFVMPRGGRLIIGTTETRFRGNPDHAHPHAAEESYLLNVFRHYFPDFGPVNRRSILASWAGLRVLPSGEGHAFHRSRETILQKDRDQHPRVVSIYGGKLTSYRATAEKLVAQIADSLPERARRGHTEKLPLSPD